VKIFRTKLALGLNWQKCNELNFNLYYFPPWLVLCIFYFLTPESKLELENGQGVWPKPFLKGRIAKSFPISVTTRPKSPRLLPKRNGDCFAKPFTGL